MKGLLAAQAYTVCVRERFINVTPAADGVGCAWEGDSRMGGGTGSLGKCKLAGPCCVSVLCGVCHIFFG